MGKKSKTAKAGKLPKTIAGVKVPKGVEAVAGLPRTASGKLVRGHLR